MISKGPGRWRKHDFVNLVISFISHIFVYWQSKWFSTLRNHLMALKSAWEGHMTRSTMPYITKNRDYIKKLHFFLTDTLDNVQWHDTSTFQIHSWECDWSNVFCQRKITSKVISQQWSYEYFQHDSPFKQVSFRRKEGKTKSTVIDSLVSPVSVPKNKALPRWIFYLHEGCKKSIASNIQ